MKNILLFIVWGFIYITSIIWFPLTYLFFYILHIIDIFVKKFL